MNTKEIRKALSWVSYEPFEYDEDNKDHLCYVKMGSDEFGGISKGNAEFIKNAPDYCRFLLAKVEELEKERASEKRQYEATCVFYLEEQEKNKALQSQIEVLTKVAIAADKVVTEFRDEDKEELVEAMAKARKVIKI